MGAFGIGGVNIPTPTVTLPPITIGGGGGGAGSGGMRERAVAIVNGYEPYFAAVMDDYRAARVTAEEGAARFDELWLAMVAQLQSLGTEGTRAIADRKPGGAWDWFRLYRPQGVLVPIGVGVGSVPGLPPATGLPPVLTRPVTIAGQKLQPWFLLLAVGVVVWFLRNAGVLKR